MTRPYSEHQDRPQVSVVSDVKASAVSSRDAYEVLIVRDSDSFDSLQREWDDLLDRSVTKTPFMMFPWTRAWWRHFGREAKLLILVVRKAGQVVGIAPLMVSRRAVLGIPYRELEFIASGRVPGVTSKGMSDRLDLLVDEAHQAEGTRILIREIFRLRNEWDLVNLRPVPQTSPTIAQVRYTTEAKQANCLVMDCSVSPYVPVASDWATYIRSRSLKTRNNYKRSVKLFTKKQDIRFELVEDPATIVRLFPRILDESVANSPLRQAGSDLFYHANTRAFFVECLADLGGRDVLKVFLLYKGETIIAHIFAFLLNRTLWDCNSGYNMAYKRFAPGWNVRWRAIQWAFTQGLDEVDLLSGDHEYKRNLTEATRVDQRIVISGKKGLRIGLVVFITVTLKDWMRKQSWAKALEQRIRILKNRLSASRSTDTRGLDAGAVDLTDEKPRGRRSQHG